MKAKVMQVVGTFQGKSWLKLAALAVMITVGTFQPAVGMPTIPLS